MKLKVIVEEAPNGYAVIMIEANSRRVIGDGMTQLEATNIARAASIGIRAAFAVVARAAMAAREE